MYIFVHGVNDNSNLFSRTCRLLYRIVNDRLQLNSRLSAISCCFCEIKSSHSSIVYYLINSFDYWFNYNLNISRYQSRTLLYIISNFIEFFPNFYKQNYWQKETRNTGNLLLVIFLIIFFFHACNEAQARLEISGDASMKSAPGSGEKRDKFASTFYGSNLPWCPNGRYFSRGGRRVLPLAVAQNVRRHLRVAPNRHRWASADHLRARWKRNYRSFIKISRMLETIALYVDDKYL